MSEGYSNINNYSFKKDIGEGNFGKVKLGIYNPTGEEFAIKVLNKDKIKIKMKNSIFKENQIITKFNHINVIYVFQILEDKDNFYIIMEYCKHGELFDYIVKNEKLSEEEASIFFYQLINGIEHIHSKGISHRDLKPENLLLAENNILKIIDFGLSHEFWGDGDELLKTKCGSPSYAAPEIICCPLYDGFKVDIWCSGIILYAMVCGYLPFEGDNNDILFKNILDCDPEFPDFLSDMSIDLILKILNPNPEKRITIEEIKKHKFYLMGKKLCNIDYDTIENSIIKKRNIIFKNLNESNNKNLFNINKSNDNMSKNNEIKYKYSNTLNNKFDKNYNDKISDILTNKNKNNLNLIKNNYSLDVFKKKFMDINYNKKTIDTVENKIKLNLKTEVDDNNNKNSKANSSKKKKNLTINTNTNIITTSNNIDKNKKLKPFDFILENKNNKKYKKDSLFIKILNTTKNNFLSCYKQYEKLGLIKYNTNKTNIDENGTHNKIIKSINKSGSNSKNKINKKDKKNIMSNKNNNEIRQINNHIISLSNDNLNNNSNNSNNNNKKNQKYNLFKEALKNNNKGKYRFNIMKALSHYESKSSNIIKNTNTPNSPTISKKSSGYINSNSNTNTNSNVKISKKKEINFIVPNSTLYYNNINININELNINPKSSKNRNTHFISINNQKDKKYSKDKNSKIDNIYYYFNSLENKNIKKNKTISEKKSFSYNIKKNKSNKDNIKSINNKENIYNISNNFNNENFFIKMINENIKKNKYLNKNNTIKKNKNSSKLGRILSTEPKEKIKFRKQFSFNKEGEGQSNEKNKNEYNNKKTKINKRSKSEKANKFKTINTEVGKNIFFNKKYINKFDNPSNKYKNEMNKIDEIILYMFMEHKYNKKKNNNKESKK